MTPAPQVATAPAKPLMIFDGDCRFCRFWINRWRQTTGDRVDYLPFQDPQVPARFPELAREQFEEAVQLIETDGRVYGGADAVFRSLAYNLCTRWPLWLFQKIPGVAPITECSYRFVAKHRTVFSALTRLAWGNEIELPTHRLVRWVFLRLLGVIYLIAFVSLWTQISGLIGHQGILPAAQMMEAAEKYFDQQDVGLNRFHLLPTLCWMSASDGFLHFLCATGTVLAVVLIIGIAPAPCLFLLWLVYLSLSVVCRDFLGFQWDILLLETGFLAIFCAPLQLWPGLKREAPQSRIVLWLLRWLLFRLMFESGCVKLFSGDVLWRNLTALTVHYETQPLPTWIGWYAHQLPLWAQKSSAVIMFVIELAVPFLIFAPRRLRLFGCVVLIGFQLLIAATGNYTFFNLLTIALCLLLLDDVALRRMTPRRWRPRFSALNSQPSTLNSFLRWPRWVVAPLAAVILLITLMQLLSMLRPKMAWPSPIAYVANWLAPFRSVNTYGLFAIMTGSRLEIVIEGSNDGKNWLPYEFKYKPGDPKRRPVFVAPHQPRLDWQMWFAALSRYRDNPWFINLCLRLLEGSPNVLALLEKNPFPNAPPRFIRAEFYDYRFTDFATRQATGLWWKRERKGEYFPAISLREEDLRR
ncbi:MAG: lipase maturation factor family protein [Verrucomicrobia bacterium]|nr:lipase maturation factor family protein [Verrucomicrobiota bacterium]